MTMGSIRPCYMTGLKPSHQSFAHLQLGSTNEENHELFEDDALHKRLRCAWKIYAGLLSEKDRFFFAES